MTEVFYTHNNGDRPFKVEINKNKVKIYSNDVNNNTTKHLATVNAKKVFVGKSPKNEMTIFSGGHGKKFLGNSILLELKPNTYQFIGNIIFSFATHEKIVKYVSPVGNNDVPYPYAIDASGNYYLMIENIVLKHTTNLNKLITKYDDPYSYYYKANLITADTGRVPQNNPLRRNFGGVKEYYIDKDQYTLRYRPNPDADYDRLIPALGKYMYIVDLQGNKSKLTRKKYVKLINDFGKIMGFEQMEKID